MCAYFVDLLLPAATYQLSLPNFLEGDDMIFAIKRTVYTITYVCVNVKLACTRRGSYLPPGESFEAYAVDLEQSLAHCSDVISELPMGDFSTLNISGMGSLKSISNNAR